VPYWIAMIDNLAKVGAFSVSVVKHCKLSFGGWFEHLHALGSHALRF
jgi:hypothetical protein